MTAVSPEPEHEPLRPKRRRRYERCPEQACTVFTPRQWEILELIAAYRIISRPQLARLTQVSDKALRRSLRGLFDAGAVEVVAVPRAALVASDTPNDARLLFGSAPNVYTVAKAGCKMLQRAGLVEGVLTVPSYGPRNTLFLAHSLEIRDVRIWLDVAARHSPGHQLARWQDGAEAHIDLKNPPQRVRPDAWFVYHLEEKTLVGLLEVDRGTERGGRQWQEKITAYRALFGSGRLKEITGFHHARVLVITPSASRRDSLAELIVQQADPALAGRFWLAERRVLEQDTLGSGAWRHPTSQHLQPLIPPPVAGIIQRDDLPGK